MKALKTGILPLLSILTLQSCGSGLSVYKIKGRPEDYNVQQVVNDYYNEDAKLGYTVLKDDDYLHVNISTTETASQMKMLQNGVILFLDKDGKKNENFYIQYPLASDSKALGNIKALMEGKTALLKKRISGLKDDILVVRDDSQEYINRLLNDDGITTEIKVVEEELFYQIKFPIGYIASNCSKPSSLGIALKGLEMGSFQRDPSARPANVGGGRGGGMRGGGMRRGGGRRGGGRPGGGTKAPSSPMKDLGSNVAIWFKLDLSH